MKLIRSLLLFAALACGVSAHAQRIFTAPLTFTSASGTAYTANDVVGVVNTITNAARIGFGGFVRVDNLVVSDDANQNKGFVLLFFSAAPTVTDNAIFSWGTLNANLPNLLGAIEIRSDDYVTVNSIGIVSRASVQLTMKAGDSVRDIYVVAVTTSTPTYGSGGKLRVNLGLTYF